MTRKKMSSFLERTLAAYQNDEPITRYIEEALMLGEVFPEEYPVKVFNKERKFDNMYHPSSDVTAGELQLYYSCLLYTSPSPRD